MGRAKKKGSCQHPLGWAEAKRFRHYLPLISHGGRCVGCRTTYDLEVLGSDMCPKCGKSLEPTYVIHSIVRCPLCGEEREIEGVLK